MICKPAFHSILRQVSNLQAMAALKDEHNCWLHCKMIYVALYIVRRWRRKESPYVRCAIEGTFVDVSNRLPALRRAYVTLQTFVALQEALCVILECGSFR